MDDRLRNVEVHLGRVEQRVEDHEGDIRAFGALPIALAELKWHLEQQGKSLDAVHEAQREIARAVEDRKHEIEAAREERQVQIESLEATRRENEKEQRALNLELKDRDEQRKLENRRLFYGLAALFISSLAPIVASLLGGGHP